jgi:L-fuconolactonase
LQRQPFQGNTHRNPAMLDAWLKDNVEAAVEPNLQIIDPHHHAWHDHRGRYGFEELLDDLTGCGHNVIASVFVEARAMYCADGPADMRSVGEVEFVSGIAATSASGHFGRVRLCEGIVGHADLMLGDAVQPVLDALVAAGSGRLRGVRDVVAWDTSDATKFSKRSTPQHLMADASFRKGFARLQASGLSFDTYQFYPQLPDLASLLAAFPEANVVLNHVGGPLGIPPHSDHKEMFARWRENMRQLVPFSNLCIKVGGLGMLHLPWVFHFGDRPPSSDELANAWHPYVETCIELFGPQRCMMESNFPVDKQTCSYGVLWNALKKITLRFADAEKAALYSGTAARFYRLSHQA